MVDAFNLPELGEFPTLGDPSPNGQPKMAKLVPQKINIDKPLIDIEGPDGKMYKAMEQTFTIEMDGQFFNIPSIVDGVQYSPEEAITKMFQGYNHPTGIFPTREEAEAGAQARTEELSQLLYERELANMPSVKDLIDHIPEGKDVIVLPRDEEAKAFLRKHNEETGEKGYAIPLTYQEAMQNRFPHLDKTLVPKEEQKQLLLRWTKSPEHMQMEHRLGREVPIFDFGSPSTWIDPEGAPAKIAETTAAMNIKLSVGAAEILRKWTPVLGVMGLRPDVLAREGLGETFEAAQDAIPGRENTERTMDILEKNITQNFQEMDFTPKFITELGHLASIMKIFQVGASLGSFSYKHGVDRLFTVANAIGGERAVHAMGQWVARSTPGLPRIAAGKVDKTLEAMVAGAGSFGIIAGLDQKSWEDIGKEGLVGAATFGITRPFPDVTKIFKFNLAPIKRVVEAATMVGAGSALFEDREFGVGTVSHATAMIFMLGLIHKGASLPQVERWMNKLGEKYQNDGWITEQQLKEWNYLRENALREEFKALVADINKTVESAGQGQIRIAEMAENLKKVEMFKGTEINWPGLLQKIAKGEPLTDVEMAFADAMRLGTHLSSANDVFQRVFQDIQANEAKALPAGPQDLARNKFKYPEIEGDPGWLIDAARDMQGTFPVTARFLDHLPRKSMITMSDVRKAFEDVLKGDVEKIPEIPDRPFEGKDTFPQFIGRDGKGYGNDRLSTPEYMLYLGRRAKREFRSVEEMQKAYELLELTREAEGLVFRQPWDMLPVEKALNSIAAWMQNAKGMKGKEIYLENAGDRVNVTEAVKQIKVKTPKVHAEDIRMVENLLSDVFAPHVHSSAKRYRREQGIPYTDFIRTFMERMNVLDKAESQGFLQDYGHRPIFSEHYRQPTTTGAWTDRVRVYGGKWGNYLRQRIHSFRTENLPRYVFHIRSHSKMEEGVSYVTEVQADLVSHLKNLTKNPKETVKSTRYRQELLPEFSKQEVQRMREEFREVEKRIEELLEASHREDLVQQDIYSGRRPEELTEVEIAQGRASRERAESMAREIQTLREEQTERANYGAIQMLYDAMGIRSPDQFYQRAVEETLRDTAKDFIQHRRAENTSAYMEPGEVIGRVRFPTANTMLRINGTPYFENYHRTNEFDARLRTREDLLDEVGHIAESTGTNLAPIYKMHQRMERWIMEHFKEAKIVEGEGFRWIELPVKPRMAERAPEVFGTRPGQVLDVTSAIPMWIERGQRAVSTGARRFFEAHRTWREEFNRDFDPADRAAPQEIIRDVRGYNAFTAAFTTLQQKREIWGPQVPALEIFIRHLSEPYTRVDGTRMEGAMPFRNAWLERGQERVVQLQALAKGELKELQRLTFDEVEAGATSHRHFTDAEINAGYHMTPATWRAYKNMKADFRDFMQELKKYSLEKARRTYEGEELRQMEEKLTKEFDLALRKPYFPLMRYGNYTVMVRNQDTKEYEYVGFQWKWQAEKFMKKMEREYRDRSNISISLSKKFEMGEVTFMGVQPEILHTLRDIAKRAGERDRVAEMEKVIQTLAPVRGFAARLIKRKLIPGYSRDVVRGYAQYMYHGASHLMRAKYADQLKADVKLIEEQIKTASQRTDAPVHLEQLARMHKDMLKTLDYIISPKNELAGVRAFLFQWYFAYNPRAALVNLTQVPLVLYPYLAARHGDKNAIFAINKAGKDAMSYMLKGEGLTLREQELVMRALKEGILTDSWATEMAGAANGKLLNKVRPAHAEGVGGKAIAHSLNTFKYIVDKGPALFQHSEHYNRYVAFISGIRLSENTRAEAVYRDGKNAVQGSMFIYSRWNRAPFMRGKLGSNVFVFQQFMQQMLMFALRDPGASRYLSMMLLSGGVMGLPLAEDMLDLWDGIRKMAGFSVDGERTDTRKDIMEALQVIGIDPMLAMYGAGSKGFGMDFLGKQVMGPPIDVHGNISMGRIIPGMEMVQGLITDSDRSADTAAGGAIRDALGAAVNLPVALWSAVNSNSPYKWKTWEQTLPVGLKNASRGLRYMVDGREMRPDGSTLVSFDGTERYGAAVKAMLGFQLHPVVKEYKKSHTLNLHLQYHAARFSELAQAYVYALETGDEEYKQDVREAIKDYNKTAPFPVLKISTSRLAASVRERKRRRARRDRGLGRTKQEKVLKREFDKLYESD